MKKLILSLAAFALALNASSQTAEEAISIASGTDEFRLGGTIKYGYVPDEYGRAMKNGTLTLKAKLDAGVSYANISANYSLTANYKKGSLHGAVTGSGKETGKTYAGNYNCTYSFSGAFVNGKPNGAFNASVKTTNTANNGTDLIKASVNYKNGELVGSYYVSDKFQETVSGQFTSTGVITGTWKEGSYSTSVYSNGVLLSRTYKTTTTPPIITEAAKKYAAKTITKEELEAQGFMVLEQHKKINDDWKFFISERFGLPAIKGYEFKENDKIYYEIIKPATFTDDGFNLFKAEFAEDLEKYGSSEIDYKLRDSCLTTAKWHNNIAGYRWDKQGNAEEVYYINNYQFYMADPDASPFKSRCQSEVYLTDNQVKELYRIRDEHLAKIEAEKRAKEEAEAKAKAEAEAKAKEEEALNKSLAIIKSDPHMMMLTLNVTAEGENDSTEIFITTSDKILSSYCSEMYVNGSHADLSNGITLFSGHHYIILKTKKTTIPKNFIKDNQDIVEVYFPTSLKKISAFNFSGCSNLKSIFFYSDTAPKLGNVKVKLSTTSSGLGNMYETPSATPQLDTEVVFNSPGADAAAGKNIIEGKKYYYPRGADGYNDDNYKKFLQNIGYNMTAFDK